MRARSSARFHINGLKERQAHSLLQETPDGPRFESGRAHHEFSVEQEVPYLETPVIYRPSRRSMKESPYLYLLKDSNFKRWYDNVARGSIITATVWLRRVGMLEAKFGKTPQQLAKMRPRQAGNFLMDIVTTMQKEGKQGGYISSCIKPLKNWLEFNDVKDTTGYGK